MAEAAENDPIRGTGGTNDVDDGGHMLGAVSFHLDDHA